MPSKQPFELLHTPLSKYHNDYTMTFVNLSDQFILNVDFIIVSALYEWFYACFYEWRNSLVGLQ